MDIKGIKIISEGDNFIQVDNNSRFELSQIKIKGSGNKVIIEEALLYHKLTINLIGNNKEIIIKQTKKNINNLKIVSIRGDFQKVWINENFSCGGCEIQMNDGYENLEIGKDNLFSWGIKIRTSDGHSIIDLENQKAINLPQNITIGNHVWISEDVKILKGVNIPNNCVIGSGAMVTKSFDKTDENTIIAGFPAKIVKRNITWDRRMPYQYNKVVDNE